MPVIHSDISTRVCRIDKWLSFFYRALGKKTQNPAYRHAHSAAKNMIYSKKTFWTIPFISFVLGYIIAQWIFTTPPFPAPHIVGKTLYQALPIVSQHQLNLRLIDQKEESDIPAGIILTQTPQAGSSVKTNQPLFVVTTKKPAAIKAPTCINVSYKQIIHELKDSSLQFRTHHITHPYPQGICFAQSPNPGHEVECCKLIIYISAGEKKSVILPTFIGKTEEEISTFLSSYSITPHIIYENKESKNGIIIDQRPQAGTIVTIDEEQPLSITLQIG